MKKVNDKKEKKSPKEITIKVSTIIKVAILIVLAIVIYAAGWYSAQSYKSQVHYEAASLVKQLKSSK